jgi:ABC-2 type transport system ATP-binding protein
MSILKCSNLTKRFGGTLALSNVSLSIEPGRVIGLLGPNGSGKTTFIKLCNGLLTPTEGDVRIDNMSPGVETKAIVSYLPENAYFNDWMKVQDMFSFFGDFYRDFDAVKAGAMLKALGIEKSAHIKSLSKGTKEKVQLILVMARKAGLYLLDEPIGGVDPAVRDYILSTIIKNYNPEASVIISTHLIADVEQVLDEVIFLKDGEIALHQDVDAIREEKGMSVDKLFREVFKCSEN